LEGFYTLLNPTHMPFINRIADLFFKTICLLFPAAMVYIIMTDGDGCGDLPRDFRFFPIAPSIAFGLSIIWSLIDKQKPEYKKLAYWLQIVTRYFLAYIIMQYGAAKVIDMQFSSSINGLDTKVIDLGPMGLAWAFFGFSFKYEFFIGCFQIVAAMLLLYRRTATLGAILMVTIMANIVFVNFSFNVCVKFFSCTYLVMAMYLLVDDARRLSDFFIFNRVAQARTYPELFTKKLFKRIFTALGILAFLGIIVYPVYDSYRLKVKYSIGQHSVVYGVWTVDSVHASSAPLNQQLNADSSGWKKIIFENYDNALFKSWKNTRSSFNYEVDTAKHTINMKQRFPDTTIVMKVNYHLNKDTLILNGTYNKDTVFAKMRLQRRYFIR